MLIDLNVPNIPEISCFSGSPDGIYFKLYCGEYVKNLLLDRMVERANIKVNGKDATIVSLGYSLPNITVIHATEAENIKTEQLYEVSILIGWANYEATLQS